MAAPRTVLVLDEAPLAAMALQEALQEAGFIVVGVTGLPDEARQIACARPPRFPVVSVDLGQGRSGPALTAFLLARGVAVLPAAGVRRQDS